jgi:hypothetical protein
MNDKELISEIALKKDSLISEFKDLMMVKNLGNADEERSEAINFLLAKIAELLVRIENLENQDKIEIT